MNKREITRVRRRYPLLQIFSASFMFTRGPGIISHMTSVIIDDVIISDYKVALKT